MPPSHILISAGEASGDMYAARLAVALQARAEVRLFGMGGPRMREAGVELLAECHEVSVVGILEVLKKLPVLNRVWDRLLEQSRRRKPDLAILTDFPGFHVRLARVLKRQGIRNVFFVSPQFWAWRPWRARLVRRRFALALCIFPFEEPWYRARGVAAQFIGHPLVGEVRAGRTRAEFASWLHLDAARPIVALLPGSRPGEITQHLPTLVQACRLIQQQRPVQFVVPLAPDVEAADLERYFPPDVPVRAVADATYDALAAADLAIVSSGTATIEAALLNTPMIVIYRVAPLTAAIARFLVLTDMYAMVNLIAGERVVPELIQNDFTAEKVAKQALALLDSPEAIAKIRVGLNAVRTRLGPAGAIDRAADIIVAMLNQPGEANR